ncbi:hypothetical protein BDY21DRAFT_258314, partial [Lineolata rhizophorae]
MDITEWYMVALAGILAFSIVASRLIRLARTIRKYFLNHVFYPYIHRYLRGSKHITRFNAILIVVFWVGNILCSTIGVKDVLELARRSALLSTINLIPVLLGAHMNIIVSYYGIRLPTYTRIHACIGIVAVIEGLVHTVAISSLQKPNLKIQSDAAGLTAAITTAIILLSSVASIRRYIYEAFSKLHLILAAIAVGSIYIHCPSKQLWAPPVVYLFTAVCLHILISLVRFFYILYRNIKHKRPLNRATMRTLTYKRLHAREIQVSDAIHVHVRLSRPWRPRAGQYIYLCIPGVNYTSFMQLHPFYVSWWYYDADGNHFLVLLVQKRRGFTKDLFSYTSDSLSHEDGRRALIEGPYGKELDLGSYDTVILFATGIGIAAQLPYVRRLLERYRTFEVETQRIALFWEIESELHVAWVADMMDELLEKDTDKILDIQLFVLGKYISIETRPGDIVRIGKRIDVNYRPMDPESLIRKQTESRKGRIVVSLCTNNETNDKIREIVRRIRDKSIDFKELEFRP